MEKDTTSKQLEGKNDVFAEIFNNLLFSGRPELKIQAEQLKDEPTETIYTDYDGNIRNMYRDIIKSYSSGQKMVLVFLGLENESRIDRTVAVRLMGYAFTQYKKQLDEYTNSKRELLRLQRSAKTNAEAEFVERQLAELGEFHIIPVLTLVLCYDDKDWDQPKSLKELAGDNPYTDFMQDFQATVYNMRTLPEATRRKFTGDFGYVLDAIIKKEIKPDGHYEALKYPVESLDMLYAYTGDQTYKEIRKRIVLRESRGEEMNMKTFWDEVKRDTYIQAARTNDSIGMPKEKNIVFLMETLHIDEAEAHRVFETEVKKPA